MIAIRPAAFPADAQLVRAIFREYAASLSVDLTFQDFEGELAGLPGKFAAPGGAVLLAFDGAALLGCVALRPLAEGVGEMKRLYVRPAGRGRQLGRVLAQSACDAASARGYRSIRLDTLPEMAAAQQLYASLGFGDVAPYVHNPIQGTRFLEKNLRAAG